MQSFCDLCLEILALPDSQEFTHPNPALHPLARHLRSGSPERRSWLAHYFQVCRGTDHDKPMDRLGSEVSIVAAAPKAPGQCQCARVKELQSMADHFRERAKITERTANVNDLFLWVAFAIFGGAAEAASIES